MRNIPRLRFQQQRSNAIYRGIAWELTFEQWWAIWVASGLWTKRGRRRHQYCMARKGDLGAYKVGNVEIITNRRNCLAAPKTTHTPEERQRISERMKGNTNTLGLKHRPIAQRRHRAAAKANWTDPEYRERMRVAAKAGWAKRRRNNLINPLD